MGDFIKNNAFISQDIYYETAPKFGIGVAGSYAVKATTPVAGSSNNATGIYDEKWRRYERQLQKICG